MAVTREKLYGEVWAEPMIVVAKRYDVSSSFLARVCARLQVPHPPRGYWAKRAVGIEIKPPALPTAEPGAEIEWVRDGSEAKRQPLSAGSSPMKRSKRAKGGQHPLVNRALADFSHARPSRDEQYVRPYKRNLVDIFVSKDLVDTALKFANTLFQTLEEHGYRATLAPASARFRRMDPEVCEGVREAQSYYYSPGRWSPAQPTVAFVGEVAFGLTVFEVGEEVEVRYDSTLGKYVRVAPTKAALGKKIHRNLVPQPREWTTKHWLASGRLGVHAYAAQQNIEWERYWREAKAGELTGILETIVKELEAALPRIKELVARSEREAEEHRVKWEAQQREWAREAEEQRRIQREATRQKEIAETISNWRMARDVRAYVAGVYALVKSADLRITEGTETEQELKWALAYADRIDPLTPWREDIEKTKAKAAAKQRPEVHDATTGRADVPKNASAEPGDEEARGAGDETQPADRQVSGAGAP